MVIEKSGPSICTEMILRISILLDHLPSNYDAAFTRVQECLERGEVHGNAGTGGLEPHSNYYEYLQTEDVSTERGRAGEAAQPDRSSNSGIDDSQLVNRKETQKRSSGV